MLVCMRRMKARIGRSCRLCASSSDAIPAHHSAVLPHHTIRHLLFTSYQRRYLTSTSEPTAGPSTPSKSILLSVPRSDADQSHLSQRRRRILDHEKNVEANLSVEDREQRAIRLADPWCELIPFIPCSAEIGSDLMDSSRHRQCIITRQKLPLRLSILISIHRV